MFGPKSLAVKGNADLAGKSVAVARGTLEDLSVSKVAPPSATIKRFDDPNGAIAAFLSGQAQLLVVGNDVGATIIARHPSIDPEQKFSLFSSPDHVGLNKNEPRLMQKVNDAIAGARKSGTLNALSQKWLHAALPADSRMRAAPPRIHDERHRDDLRVRLQRLRPVRRHARARDRRDARLTAAATVLGGLIGTTGAWVALAGPRWARMLVAAYVELIRNTPLWSSCSSSSSGCPGSACTSTKCRRPCWR